MKQRILALVMSAAIFCNGMVVAAPVVAAEDSTPAATGKTYYVSTLDGNDSNDGLSEDHALYSLKELSKKALGPGDHIYLERGSNFYNDYLHLYNVKGSQDAPIVIADYGDTNKAKPVINTNGEGVWFQNYGKQLGNSAHVNTGYVSSAVLLYDCEYIEMQDVAMTNKALSIDTAYNDRNAMNRTGVAVVAQNGGTLDHIYLKNLDIRDVKGNVYDKHMNNGGIYFTTFKAADENATGIPRYNDVLIEGCYLQDVNRWGIALAYTAYWDQFTSAEISDEAIATYGSGNVVIRNNYIKDVGGDAITAMYCDRPLIEYNISDGAAKQMNNTDYSETGFGRVAAAVWPWKCKDAVLQYNEVFGTHNYNQENNDGQAFDADWGDGTIYQYNYSHDNEGGCFMICGVQAVNSVFRYNISQNDGRAVMIAAGNPVAQVYNNTFYIKEGVPFIGTNTDAYGNMNVSNNILYYSGQTPSTENWHTDKVNYSNNIFYHYANTPDNGKNNLTQDPMLKAPGTATNFASLKDTYQLQEGSPAIGAGTPISNNGGQDLFGNKVKGIPSIGAHQVAVSDDNLQFGSTVYTVDEKNQTIDGVNWASVDTFLDNLILGESWTVTVKDKDGKEVFGGEPVRGGYTFTYDRHKDGEQPKTYTIVASNQATMENCLFEVKDTTMSIPMTDNGNPTVEQVLSGIQLSRGATASILNQGQPVASGKVTEGMTLRITAEDGKTTTDYTIQKKNDYNYLENLKNGVAATQGNVWFAQEQLADGSYQNMPQYNTEWKGWTANDNTNWQFVGADSGENPTTVKIVDRLKDRTNQGHALGFRAPLSGEITITAKDGLKLIGKNGTGEVWVSVLKNDQPTIQKTKLDNNAQTGVELQETIQVNRGDFIRVQVQNQGATVQAGGVQANLNVQYTKVDGTADDNTAPTAPTAKIDQRYTTGNSLFLSWTESSDDQGIQGYNIYQVVEKSNTGVSSMLRSLFGAEKAEPQQKQLASVSANQNWYTVTNLKADTQYTFAIKAVDWNGNESAATVLTGKTAKEEVVKPTEQPTEVPNATPQPTQNPTEQPQTPATQQPTQKPSGNNTNGGNNTSTDDTNAIAATTSPTAVPTTAPAITKKPASATIKVPQASSQPQSSAEPTEKPQQSQKPSSESTSSSAPASSQASSQANAQSSGLPVAAIVIGAVVVVAVAVAVVIIVRRRNVE